MQALGLPNRHQLAWQSQVGPLPWLGPQTGEVLQGYGARGVHHVLAVPIAFTSDHVETLYEIDIEYAHVAQAAGVTHFKRAPSLNDEPLFLDALAQVVHEHLRKDVAHASTHFPFRCPSCVNPQCRHIENPVRPYTPTMHVPRVAAK
jgi:ferrochelatase